MKNFFAYLFDLTFRKPKLRYFVWGVIVFLLIYGSFYLFYQEVVTFPVGWEKSVIITPYTLKIKSPYAVSKGNVIAAAFEGNEKNENGVYITLSLNAGHDFLPPYKLDTIDPAVAIRPHVAISNNGHIACTWHNLINNRSAIMLTISNDLGATWTKPVALSFISDQSMLSQVYYDASGGLHLFFHGTLRGRVILYHAYSIDELNFSQLDTITDISSEYRGIFFPAIAFSNNAIYIVMQGKTLSGGLLSDDLFFLYSTNNGKSFSNPKKITTSPANDSSPSIILHNDIIYCVYQNNENRQWGIKLLRGFDKGKNWETQPFNVTTANIDCFQPRVVAASNDDLIIVWHDARERYEAVFAKKFSLIDNTLASEVRISDPNVNSNDQFPVLSGQRILLFWNSNERLIAKFSDISVLPPRIYSVTHPEGRWTRSTTAILEWIPPVDESGIAGYAVIYNELPAFDPAVQNIEGPIRKYIVTDLKDGVTYFHIRAIDRAGNYSRTIHYPLMVSSTPLPMPMVSSPTHPEGTQINNPSPVLQWTIDEDERVKGFYYSIAKDAIKEPSDFTTANTVGFNNLPQGRYFFSLRPIDKTNMKGRIATYEIVIGNVEKADAEYYEKLAKGIVQPQEKPEEGMVVQRKYPSVVINIPFKEIYATHFYRFQLIPRNITPQTVDGFSVIVANNKEVPPFFISHNEGDVTLTNVKPGKYVIAARMRYSDYQNGKRVYRWTKPCYRELMVKSAHTSPLMHYADNLYVMIKDRQLITAIYSVGLLAIVLIVGMSARISFSFQKLLYRVSLLFR